MLEEGRWNGLSTAKVTSWCRRHVQGHHQTQVPRCSLPPMVKHQPPQLWLPQGQHEETTTGSAGPCLSKGRGAVLLLCSVSAGCPPAGALCWSTARAIVLLLFVHHPQAGSCIPMLSLLPVLQGTVTKHSAGTEKHCIQMNLSSTCKWKKIWYGLYWEIKNFMMGFILLFVFLAIRITGLFLISHCFYKKLLWFSCLNPDLHPSWTVEIILNAADKTNF